MSDNVIDVDFTPVETVEVMARNLRRELNDLSSEIRRSEAKQLMWERWQRRRLLDRIRVLRDALNAERARAYKFEDIEALEALVKIHSANGGTGPVNGGAVAESLFVEPTHSAKVRVGQALGRLCAAGLVERIPHPSGREYGPYRWVPIGGDDA
jgi:hypothetical protein